MAAPHTPPSQPTSLPSPDLNTSPPPAPHEFSSVLHSIQRRTVDRASTDLSSTSWRLKGAPTDHLTVLSDLEADLRLSAQVGVALLEDKASLEKRLAIAEGGNQKLLDRLTSSVKEAAQLQRRLEEAVGNLEQADANNRALLVSLEEDRKTISRLSLDSGKLVATSATLKNLTRAHEDTRQELVAERKRATAAESRHKRQSERVAEMEERLKRAIEDLEEMRQDKVLRSRKSVDALARVKAKYARAGLLLSSTGALAENPEAAELLKLVESLVSENDLLRSESQELHEMLDHSRDEQMAHRDAFAEEDEDGTLPTPLGRRTSTTSQNASSGPLNLLSEVLSSPSLSQSISQSFSDFDGNRPISPASTNATSFNRSWAPSSSLSYSHSHRGADLNRTLSTGSMSAGEEPSRHGYFNYAPERRNSKRRTHGTSGSISGPMNPPVSGGGKVPFGRGHSRRAMSVDVSSIGRHSDLDARSAPASPHPDQPTSPFTRPASLFSATGSEADDTSSMRPRRHHRPLSLSLGPSLFPLVPEDEQSPKVASHRRRPSQTTGLSYSTSGEASLVSIPSGLSLSSPTKENRMRQASSTNDSRCVVTVDSSTQTSPPPSPTRRGTTSFDPRSTSTPRRIITSTSSPRSLSPQPDFARSQTTSSDLSEGDRYLDLAFAPDSRTAVLSTLIEHTAKLLSRIQTADITTQERRLKKQHLSGDVRHLAQANLKDLLNDIEGLRTHFRRVLEQERSTTKETSATEATLESLVVRRDFVALVKLFRDLLFESSRLRSLVNRVQLEPNLASSLRELDVVNLMPDGSLAPKSSGGLLAPLSRLFGTSAPEPELLSATSSHAPRTPAQLRPAMKNTGSSAVTSATVNVEFGSGAVRRAVASRPGEEGSPDTARADSPNTSNNNNVGRKSGSQVKRDLSSIFAGGLPTAPAPARNSASTNDSSWVVLPRPSASSSNPFGRLLASYRPAMSSTTNAVLDSLPHAPRTEDVEPQPTLLERQLRPRGLSDSSIRSTFVQHANPHHRILTPATLALSSEPSTAQAIAIRTTDVSSPNGSQGGGAASGSTKLNLKQQLTDSLSSSFVSSSSTLSPGGTVSRRPSTFDLRPRASAATLRSSSTLSTSSPPLPSPTVAPISISISPSSHARPSFPAHIVADGGGGASSSLFGNLSNWASKAAGLSPLTMADGNGVEEIKTKGAAGGGGGGVTTSESWSGPSSLGGDRVRREFV